MKLCIGWQDVHHDWLASGLSKNRYFLSGRIEIFIREGVAPCYSTFLRHLRVLEKGQAISQESSACVSTPTQNNGTVAVHRLTPADIRRATTSTATSALGLRCVACRLPSKCSLPTAHPWKIVFGYQMLMCLYAMFSRFFISPCFNIPYRFR